MYCGEAGVYTGESDMYSGEARVFTGVSDMYCGESGDGVYIGELGRRHMSGWSDVLSTL